MPSKAGLSWGSWLIRIGLVCIIINGILLYAIINFAVIPYLDRGRSLEEFELKFHQKQTSLVHTVESPISTATQVRATMLPNSNPTYYCGTRSCSKKRYRDN